MQPRSRGFSLVEVIIAVAILSVGITSVLQAFSFCARSSGLSCDIIKATFLAEDKLQELEFKEKQGKISSEPVQVKDTYDKFSWQYNLALNAELNLYTLGLNITWTRANREEELVLNTYLR